jgi:hypothetical protein
LWREVGEGQQVRSFLKVLLKRRHLALRAVATLRVCGLERGRNRVMLWKGCLAALAKAEL